MRLRDRLPRLVRHNLGEIVLVLADQSVPFQEPLRTSTRVDFPVTLECRMGSIDAKVDIRRVVVRSCGPDIATARI
jgi:hypothetical protein